MTQEQNRPFPKVGEVFELTASQEVTGLGIVSFSGTNEGGWRFPWDTIPVGIKKKFKLVQIGYCRDFDEVRHKLEVYGAIPEGLWMQVFSETFFSFMYRGSCVGIADSSWECPARPSRKYSYWCVRYRMFPMLQRRWGLGFLPANDPDYPKDPPDFDEEWLWLVEVEE